MQRTHGYMVTNLYLDQNDTNDMGDEVNILVFQPRVFSVITEAGKMLGVVRFG